MDTLRAHKLAQLSTVFGVVLGAARSSSGRRAQYHRLDQQVQESIKQYGADNRFRLAL